MEKSRRPGTADPRAGTPPAPPARLLIALLLAVSAIVALPVAGAGARPAAIQIVAPVRGATHLSPRAPLHVRARVAPGVRGLRLVVLSGKRRVVVKRLERQRRGRGTFVTAALRGGRELEPGPGAIFLSGRRNGARHAATTHFFVANRPAKRLLRVRGVPHRTAARPLRVRLKTSDAVDGLRVRVNGRRAGAAFTASAGGTWRGTLSPDEGLRFGRNVIAFTAYAREGSFQRIRRVVRIVRGRPFVAAGPDRRVRAQRRVRLDGRGTLPHRAGGLRLRWRIVRQPRGAKARLLGAGSVRPRLVSARPGVYRVRLSAQAAAGHGPARASATSALSAADTTTVSVQPAASPQGIPIQTVGAVDGEAGGPGVKVGPDWHPMGSGALQLVVLDGATLEITENRSFVGNDGGLLELANELGDLPQTSVVLLQKPASRSLTVSSNGRAFIGAVFNSLNVPVEDYANGRWESELPVGGWSIVGSTDGRTAKTNFGMRPAPGRPEGEITGYLQNAASSSPGQPGSTYVFNWPSSYLTFDTRSGGDEWTNEMTIAGRTYRSGGVGGEGGFHLVWLDAGTLAPRGQATIAGNRGDLLAATLGDALGVPALGAQPSLLFLTTIGQPKIPRPTEGDGWALAASRIASFGGNPHAFLSLYGSWSSQYSLVGSSWSGLAAPNAGIDISRSLRPEVSGPRLIGTLERSAGGAWRAATGGAPDGPADVAALIPDIKRVLAEPARPFTPFSGAGEAAAERYIAARLGLSSSDPRYGIRANYWDPRYDAQWANLKNDISDPNIVPPCPTEPCSKSFAAVQSKLDREFDAVAKVRTYFDSSAAGTLYGALMDEYTSGQWSFDRVAEYITSKYPPPPTEAHGPSPFEIIEGMLNAASELAPEGGAALGVAGAAVEIGDAFADANSSTTYVGATEFEAQASQFASVLRADFSSGLDGLDRIADLLVSDAGRLQEAGRLVLGEWAFDPAVISAPLDRSIAAYLWSSLLPTTFKAYQCALPPIYYPPENFRPAPWYVHEFGTPGNLQLRPFPTATSFPAKTQGGWGPAGGGEQVAEDGFVTVARQFQGDFHYLDEGVLAELFGPLDAGNPHKLGLLPSYFLAAAPAQDSPGFEGDQGEFQPNSNEPRPAFVSYSCAEGENVWREDTNERGQ